MENGKKNFLSNKFTSLNDINNDSGRNLAVNSADPALYPPMQEAPLNLSMHRVPTTQTRPNDTNHSLSQNPIVNPVNLTPEFSISSILPTQRITKESTRKRKLEKTDLSDMNQKIPKVTEKGQMPSFFIDITEPKSYGLEKSEYGNNTVYHQSRSTNNPNYPITALNYNNNMLSSYMQKTINDSSKTLEERKKEIYKKVIGENLYGNIKLNLQGLSSFKMPGSTVKKLFYVNGKLIADIINRKNDSGHVIKRVIEPMSGSAIYSNWIRLLGFKGKIIINDTNPFVILTQKAIINYPDEVLKNIEVIKNDILNIAQKHGLNFNSELFIESNSSNINQTIKKNFRENIIYYFEESLIMLTSSVSDNGRLILDIPQDPILAKHFNAYAAALYYIAQNSFHFKDDSSIDVKLNTPDTYVFNLPISIFVEQKNKTRIFPSIINHQKIKFINHIHKNTKKDTEFFNEDGWALLKRKNIGAGDLIILSDYLNNKYTNENEFYQKIKDDVIPAIQRGAQVLVINKFQKEIETFLKRQGFQVEKNENKGNPTLLALSPNIDTTQLQTQTQTQTHKLQSTYIDFLSDLYITQPKLSEPNRTITNTETLFEGQIIVELEKDRVVSEAAKKLAGLYITQPGLSEPNRTITNAETRFAGQIIVELEEDRVVSEAAKRLAGKHAEKSIIIQLKKDGEYEVVKGNPYLLRGDLRWQVVGHSREGGNEGYPGTFGGSSAQQLSNQLIALHAQLKKQFRINPRPKYISLVGCSLAAASVEDKSYAQHFGKALKHQAGWQTDIGARRLPVTVNAEGRKLSV
ncbi:C80 family cysteine peptidase, partial [Candidatus Williamhamiltonella defendens]|uniref:C80 family cysteine peptidase n=1 Tax=Candidatus Williamhamiltonella defendens TaxID=138072 RepID=UPI0020C69A32